MGFAKCRCGSYAYTFDNAWLKSVGVSGYYTHSGDKRLPTVTQAVSGGAGTEYRRIAGADSGHVHTDTTLRLWPYSRISGGIDYDIVNFRTRYIHKPINRGLGGHVQWEQRILPRLKTTLSTQLQDSHHGYRADIGWLVPSPRGMQFELQAFTHYVDSRVTDRHFYMNGLRLNAKLGGNQDKYSDLDKQNHRSLLTWVSEPAVHKTDVLAIADSRYVYTTSGPSITNDDSSHDDSSTQSDKHSCPTTLQTDEKTSRFVAGDWFEFVEPEDEGSDPGQRTVIGFAGAFYITDDGKAVCTYEVKETGGAVKTLDMINPNMGNPEGTSNWKSLGSSNDPYADQECPISSTPGKLKPEHCKFPESS